jgi:hypothetical protein
MVLARSISGGSVISTAAMAGAPSQQAAALTARLEAAIGTITTTTTDADASSSSGASNGSGTDVAAK